MKDYADIDSKFRFVILAAKRAKELLKGAKPKIQSKSKNLIRIAQEEVEQGLIEFEIIESSEDEVSEGEKDLFVVEELPVKPELKLSIPGATEPEVKAKPKKKEAKKVALKIEKKETKESRAEKVFKEIKLGIEEDKPKATKAKK